MNVLNTGRCSNNSQDSLNSSRAHGSEGCVGSCALSINVCDHSAADSPQTFLFILYFIKCCSGAINETQHILRFKLKANLARVSSDNGACWISRGGA